MQKLTVTLLLLLIIGCTAKQPVTPSVIPTKMSFEGTFGSDKITFIDGEDNVKIENNYIPCCSIYRAEVFSPKQYGRSLDLLISQSESGFRSDKTYDDIVKNIFVKGYNKFGDVTQYYNKTGMYVSYIINGQFPSPSSKRNIEVIDVIKTENLDCTCNKEVYWVKFQINIENLYGILTLKYNDPCCPK